MPNPLIESLLRAIDASPEDLPLRLHVAELLLAQGHSGEAIAQIAAVLQRDPGAEDALAAMARALGATTAVAPSASVAQGDPLEPANTVEPTHPVGQTETITPAGSVDPAEPAQSQAPVPSSTADDDEWDRAAHQLSDAVASGDEVGGVAEPLPHGGDEPADQDVWNVEDPDVTLADVGGLQEVKDRLEVSFLAPMRNPELRAMYGKSLRGGLLLYGPPGCGKTFIARAVAGEMGARFINVTLTDVLDMYVGNSEANLHGIFEAARARTPCVVFLDEIDAIGQKRSQTRHSATRGVVNQLLSELDGIGSDNEGVYVLGATNTPWDIDPALRRPGRLDRTVLVLPPDEPARRAILEHALGERPTERLDLVAVARQTEGFTGADLAHLAESAAEKAMMDSIRTGRARPITMRDLQSARREVRPSAGPWFDTARNVVEYSDRTGEYDALRSYMQRHKLL